MSELHSRTEAAPTTTAWLTPAQAEKLAVAILGAVRPGNSK